MIAKKKFIKAILGVALATIICTQPIVAMAETSDNANRINNGIARLDYNKYSVLANQGDVIDSVVPKEGYMENGKFYVIDRTKKTLTTSPVDIAVINASIDRTYPGALLLADERLAENRPTCLVTKRAPIDITVDLKGLGSDNTVTVNDPSYGSVSAAVDTLIDKWSENHSSTHTLPARTQYSESMVYSKYQLAMSLNVDIKAVQPLLDIDFNAVAKGEEKYMVASYKQIFYTVSAKLPNNPSDLFDPSVTFTELKRKGVSEDTPPVMVNNVAYGRTIYVVLQSSSHSQHVEAAFKALIKGQDISANSEFKSIIGDSSFSVVVMGGDAQEHTKLITNDFDEIRSVIKDNATFSTKNPGYPVSYTSSFLKDNAMAAVHNTTDYIQTNAKVYSKGKINLDHSGAYVARFYIDWDEVSYDENGKEVLTHKEWKDNGKDLTAHYCTSIPLPPNAKNISIKAQECTGLAWEWWRTILDEKKVPLAGEINVDIWRTTLHPKASITFK